MEIRQILLEVNVVNIAIVASALGHNRLLLDIPSLKRFDRLTLGQSSNIGCIPTLSEAFKATVFRLSVIDEIKPVFEGF